MDNQEMFNLLMGEMGKMQQEIKQEFASVRKEIADVRGEIADVRQEMRQEFASVREEIAGVREQVKENTEFIKALRVAHEMTDAKVEALQLDVAEMKGDIKQLQKDFQRQSNRQSIIEEITAQNWQDICTLKKAQ